MAKSITIEIFLDDCTTSDLRSEKCWSARITDHARHALPDEIPLPVGITREQAIIMASEIAEANWQKWAQG